MRYTGGLNGGNWLTALTSDLGNGRFDGANLIANFDNLNPANFLWGKQYHVYANIDTEPHRYLGFEKWWGDFVLLNGEEIQYLVDKLFVGNKLTANELISNDGHIFDLRNVTCPIICFTSLGDNISPPQQSLGWILDLYRSTEEIRERGQTIIYCVDSAAGHLSIFVSAKIAVKEDASFIRTLELIECLPPGLYEMVITAKSSARDKAILDRDDFHASFECRTLDDIRAFGRNTEEDDRAFATVLRCSELNLSAYRTFMQPFIRAAVNEPFANVMRQLHPIRLSYSLFSSKNPFMSMIEPLADEIRKKRKKISPDNSDFKLQELISDQIDFALDVSGQFKDWITESLFFNTYSSPFLQGILGTFADEQWSRQPPALSPREVASYKIARNHAMYKIDKGNFDDALVRALLFVLNEGKRIDERVGEALYNLALKRFSENVSILKQIVSEQALVLHANQKESIQGLASILSSKRDRIELLKLLKQLISTEEKPGNEEKNRLDQIIQILNQDKHGTNRKRSRS